MMAWYASLTPLEQKYFWVAVASVVVNTIAIGGLLAWHTMLARRGRRLSDAPVWRSHIRTLRFMTALGWIAVFGLVIGPAIRAYFGQPQPWHLIGLMEATVGPILITARFARDTLVGLTAPPAP